LVTDGRFSGATHGIMIGHVSPEAYVGGPIALVQTGDRIKINMEQKSLNVLLSDMEFEKRSQEWTGPPPRKQKLRGYLSKYARLVGSAHEGAITSR